MYLEFSIFIIFAVARTEAARPPCEKIEYMVKSEGGQNEWKMVCLMRHTGGKIQYLDTAGTLFYETSPEFAEDPAVLYVWFITHKRDKGVEKALWDEFLEKILKKKFPDVTSAVIHRGSLLDEEKESKLYESFGFKWENGKMVMPLTTNARTELSVTTNLHHDVNLSLSLNVAIDLALYGVSYIQYINPDEIPESNPPEVQHSSRWTADLSMAKTNKGLFDYLKTIAKNVATTDKEAHARFHQNVISELSKPQHSEAKNILDKINNQIARNWLATNQEPAKMWHAYSALSLQNVVGCIMSLLNGYANNWNIDSKTINEIRKQSKILTKISQKIINETLIEEEYALIAPETCPWAFIKIKDVKDTPTIDNNWHIGCNGAAPHEI